MLTKSSARRFFLLGTVACSVSFVLLTIDTFKRIPKQTNEQNLTAEAIRGKHLFDSKNCMGCHTIMGEGAYYAPELTKVFERRGESFIKAVLKDPEAMYPGQRKMVNYHLTDQEAADLTAFLKWVGEMDLNGFPAKPDLATVISGQTAAQIEAQHGGVNQPAIFSQMCTACHSLKGVGGQVGPALDGIGLRRDPEFLSNWLRDPLAIKADSKMPKLPLSDEQIAELSKYLSSLKIEVKK